MNTPTEFDSKYSEKNKKIIESIPKNGTPVESLSFLQVELKKAFQEEEKELSRPMTYSEMRARFG